MSFSSSSSAYISLLVREPTLMKTGPPVFQFRLRTTARCISKILRKKMLLFLSFFDWYESVRGSISFSVTQCETLKSILLISGSSSQFSAVENGEAAKRCQIHLRKMRKRWSTRRSCECGASSINEPPTRSCPNAPPPWSSWTSASAPPIIWRRRPRRPRRSKKRSSWRHPPRLPWSSPRLQARNKVWMN